MSENRIAIIDYGMGNLKSVKNAFKQVGVNAVICSSSVEIHNYDKLVLPGVGSFARAMENLSNKGWVSSIRDAIKDNKPFLGICLGMQLMFGIGEEHGITKGINHFAGKVTKMTPENNLHIPHVGWNNVDWVKEHPVCESVKKGVDFYYVHSYHCVPDDDNDIIGVCDYGGPFVSSVAKGSVICTQFHPEKSQPAGMTIIENFAYWDGEW